MRSRMIGISQRDISDYEILQLAILGAAALRPGLLEAERRSQIALDENQQLLVDLRAQAARIENPKKALKRIASGHSGWSDDATERSREMKRRIAKRKGNLHPRDEGHPDHAKWVAKMRKVARTRWASMTKAERETLLRKLKRGRRRQMQGHESVRAMLNKATPLEGVAA